MDEPWLLPNSLYSSGTIDRPVWCSANFHEDRKNTQSVHEHEALYKYASLSLYLNDHLDQGYSK